MTSHTASPMNDAVTAAPPRGAAGVVRGSRAAAGTLAVVVVLMVLGGALRLHGLGTLGLIADEGYQYQAVEAVLNHGVPRLETGYAYFRSPHFIYLQAGVASVLGLDVVALRLPAVFFGVLCIPLGYLLGRDLVDARAGVLLAALLALSVWEVELSRYARFYTLLQACYIAGVWCFFRGYVRGAGPYKLAFWAVTLLAVMTHQLGAMLGLCFLTLLPLDGYTARQRLGFAARFGGVGLMYVGWRVVEKKTAGALNGAGYVAMSREEMGEVVRRVAGEVGFESGLIPGLNLPGFESVAGLWHGQPLLLAVLLLPAAAGVGAVGVLAGRERRWGRGALAAGALLAAAGQLGALALGLLLLFFAVAVRTQRDLLRPIVLLAWAGTLGLLLGHILAVSLTSDTGVLTAAWGTMHYPDVDRFLLHWLRTGWPVIGVLALGGVSVAACRARSADGRCTGRWLLVGMLVLPVLLASWVGGKHSESRYFFFLYPLILLCAVVFLQTVADGAGRLLGRRGAVPMVLGVMLAGLLLVSPDLRPAKAWSVGDRSYHDTRDPQRSVLSMPFYAEFHQDQATVAGYVYDHLGDGERVLVVGPPHRTVVYSIYAGRADYLLGNPEYNTRMTRDADGRLRDPDTGAEIITTPARLREVLSSSGGGAGLWVLADDGLRLDWPIQLDAETRAVLFEHLDPVRVMTGGDGVTFAAHLPAGDPDPADQRDIGDDPPLQHSDPPTDDE